MNQFPENIKFKYSWRKYQQRVLEDLEGHLTDGHLHVIAPPGSGKTVLGLEVAIRLNNPTLILAPTLAIRNQWIQRFCELFLQTKIAPDWISRDIRNPKFLTVVTYQGLHAACNNWNVVEDEFEDEEETEETENGGSENPNLDHIVNGLKSQVIKTIVVDEAHHLKNEWWQTLTRVKESLAPIIVGLTATPPYDVSATEWQRYIELNGPVDTEISVPELVIEGDLCPHQDYVYFTLPTDKENQGIRNFRNNSEKLFEEIKRDETIVQAIKKHPIWNNPHEQLDWIYTNLSFYSACLIFLHANEIEIPKSHLEIIGDQKLNIPSLDYEWMAIFLDFYLYKEKVYFKAYDDHREKLLNRLRRYGIIERRQINFSQNKRATGFLTSSISKLTGIRDIVNFEYNKLGKDLRLVILSDFIRKEYFVNSPENKIELNKIGVIPIFEKLRRENEAGKKMAVLTGSMIIIPASALEAFELKAAKYGISKINSSPVPFDGNYLLINPSEQLKNDIVHIITQIFQQGEIEILIGTKSLLGEGWDAPAINALILASFVGSFVLSNQMRGRAIRTQKGNQDKTGNIWHLVCVDPTSVNGGDDFDLLKRRFRSFVGISFKEEAGIENGVGRLNLPENLNHKEAVDNKNRKMLSYAADRENLRQRWDEALANGVNLVEEIRIPFPDKRAYKSVKQLYLNKTIANLMATLSFGLSTFGLESLQGLARVLARNNSKEGFYSAIFAILLLGFLIFGRLTLKTLRLYFRYRDISKDVRQIGNALLNALINAKIIQTDISNLKVEATSDSWGAVYCHLEGGSTFEKSTFINALQETIGPIDNPRYVIIRKNKLMMFIAQKDYHSVPEIIARNKKLAEFFKNQWERFVGSCELIFTRSIEGRKLLLKSRVKSLAAQFEDGVEHVNKWK
ncbi:MAG: DEAD/DEAH box helicase family protein [Cryomorphaceae bacterium]|nr:DEAD/DEAH box helicase family protein [Cryomorphaceae bacterium]